MANWPVCRFETQGQCLQTHRARLRWIAGVQKDGDQIYDDFCERLGVDDRRERGRVRTPELWLFGNFSVCIGSFLKKEVRCAGLLVFLENCRPTVVIFLMATMLIAGDAGEHPRWCLYSFPDRVSNSLLTCILSIFYSHYGTHSDECRGERILCICLKVEFACVADSWMFFPLADGVW